MNINDRRISKKHFNLAIWLLLISVSGAPSLNCAEKDGELGATSTGTINVNLRIPDTIRFNMSVDVDSSSDVIVKRQADLCIYINGGGNYSVTVTTDNDGYILSGVSKQIQFDAYWNDAAGQDDRKKLEYGVPLTGQKTNEKDTKKCIKGEILGNSNFSIEVPRERKADVLKGQYQTIISIIIAPE